MKIKIIIYWVCTAAVAFAIGSGGVVQLLRQPEAVQGMTQLGYPAYFVPILGFWKAMGALALLIPGFPRLKEWAYAGIFFDLTGAAASWAAFSPGKLDVFHMMAPLVIAGLEAASWALRPPSRRLHADYFPGVARG